MECKAARQGRLESGRRVGLNRRNVRSARSDPKRMEALRTGRSLSSWKLAQAYIGGLSVAASSLLAVGQLP